nr:50S ribosomal protein L11 methyltransferase [uncultured Bacteroides sp.]
MRYFEVTFKTTPCTETVNDVLSACLGEIGFESFIENTYGIKGYIQQPIYNEDTLKEVIENIPLDNVSISYKAELMEDKDWNEEWEKNFFQPIVIGNRCAIHSTFHKDVPEAEYDILINPQMAFGTGHHETTSLILEELLDAELQNKSLLDMGCGTSILAILAAMRGAKPITAIDIDTWCVENSKENILLNNIENISVELGDATLLKGRKSFDIVIANINRNILLNDMSFYTACMHKGSEIFMSGFYVSDIDILKEKAESLGLSYMYYKEKNNWAVVKFIKN